MQPRTGTNQNVPRDGQPHENKRGIIFAAALCARWDLAALAKARQKDAGCMMMKSPLVYSLWPGWRKLLSQTCYPVRDLQLYATSEQGAKRLPFQRRYFGYTKNQGNIPHDWEKVHQKNQKEKNKFRVSSVLRLTYWWGDCKKVSGQEAKTLTIYKYLVK